jgi:signal transduction histidine kinase
MSFRSRLFLAFALGAVIPLALLAAGVRWELTRRLTADSRARAEATAREVEGDLARESAGVAERLGAFTTALRADNRFRLSAVQGSGDRAYLLDLAGQAMRLAGLSLLQVQDSAGRILSSGHFRNEFDRLQPELPQVLERAAPAPAIVRVRTGAAPLLALVRLDSFTVAGRRFTVAGGVALDERLVAGLPRDSDLAIALALPGAARRGGAENVVAEIPVPYADLVPGGPQRLDTARVVVTRSPGTLVALRRSLDRWFLAALVVTMALALLGAAWLSGRISRPISRLAEQTDAIDLDRLDQSFASERTDEIGTLARGLGAMTERLRLGAGRLREAERRLATGDLARQVNHDVKNGLVPIRNVVRHLAQVARDEPAALARVFEERRGTLESSLAYLDTLARNYARLSPGVAREPCDVNAVVEEVVRDAAPGNVAIRTSLAPSRPSVAGDRLVLRRIVENLLSNAVESFGGSRGGEVTVGTEQADPVLVRIVIADTGPGMDRAALDRAFDDFHTTKEGGTGLGLSIVRRLVLDLDGALRVETAPGAGTRAIVELPAAGHVTETG